MVVWCFFTAIFAFLLHPYVFIGYYCSINYDRPMHQPHMFPVASIVAFFLFLNACQYDTSRSQFYHPAEFESCESTGFVWSEDYYEIVPKLIGIISKKDKVTLFVGNIKKDTIHIRNVLDNYGSLPQNVRFVIMDMPLDNIWIRDYGPAFLVNRSGEKKMVQFTYFWTDPEFIKNYSTITGIPVIVSAFQSTGGSREVNGKGTMILCEAHEMEVNQNRSKNEIEQEMFSKLGQKKIIWLKKGIPQDDNFRSGPIYDQIYPKGVNGHVDEFCRFANANTIFISSVSEVEANRHPILAEAKQRMDENLEILNHSTDQDGNKFKVIEVPFAPLIISDRRSGPEGKLVTLVTSYMNFIITDSLIILPSYVSDTSEDKVLINKEQKVLDIFKQTFPERQIIKVRADTLNYYSGGFHCISIHEPSAGSAIK